VVRRPAIGTAAAPRPRHFHHDPELRRRAETAPRLPAARPPLEHKRARHDVPRRPVAHRSALQNAIEAVERNLLLISAVLLFVGSVGWCALLYGEFQRSGLFAAPPAASNFASTGAADAAVEKSDSIGGISSYARTKPAPAAAAIARSLDAGAGRSAVAAGLVARDWNLFETTRQAEQATPVVKTVRIKPPPPAQQAPPSPPVRVASIDHVPPPVAMPHPAPELAAPRLPVNVEAKTTLVDFETAPFPYHGMVPGTDHPFLNAGAQTDPGHVNFRGRVFWESKTFGDDHVLLHIPAGFDPRRPAVMVVFFHGHGATLARDVRDRQRLPAQISSAGANAVLVAPQFAYDAADSSAGKFWQPDGFKRFLDEAAQKLAALYGDPRSQAAFATMPIVIVSYSGGFGPTLAVLARGGANARINGLVMLDSIYAGVDQFADWIAGHRSTFFVSAYTAGTAHHNAELRHLLDERSVPYSSELRRGHLQGMVTFMDDEVPHRDYVTHAWTDNPVQDILARMDDIDPNIQTAGIGASKRN
jgi:hypothetical protein